MHDALKTRPIPTLAAINAATGLSFSAAAWAVEVLGSLDIVREVTGKKRNRVFVYDAYVRRLNDESVKS